MSNLISVNIEELKDLGQSSSHNLRMKPPSYLIDNSEKNVNVCYVQELEKLQTKKDFQDYQDKLKEKIKEDYKNHNGQKMQEKTQIFKEAVVSFGREQFKNCDINDINKALINFVDNFEKKYKVKVLSHSIHLDEGHINDKNEKEHNYHAHIQIVNYDFKTHKTGMRKVNYSDLQSELAKEFEHLGFQRGRNYREEQKQENQKAQKEGRNALKIEKPTHMPHFQFRRLKTAKNTQEKAKLEEELKAKRQELEKLTERERLNNEFIKNQKNMIDKLDNQLQEKQEYSKIIDNEIETKQEKLNATISRMSIAEKIKYRTEKERTR